MKKTLTFLLFSLIFTAFACASVKVKKPAKITESVFFKVCWKGNTAVYPLQKGLKQITSCEDPVEIKWSRDRLPLRVISFTTLDPELQMAMERMNLLIGNEVFVPANVGWDIAFMANSKQRGTVLASARHFKDYGRLMGLVTKYPLIDKYKDGYRVKVYMHELGHILGLAHDMDNRKSIMHPNAPAKYFTEVDVAALKANYGKKSLHFN